MTVKKIYPAGLIGKKLGMTQVFSEEGNCIPVTVLQLGPCFVLDVKKQDVHGYSAVQLGFEQKKIQRVTKAEKGHFSHAGKGAFCHVKELRCDVQTLGWEEVGKEIQVADVFSDGEFVDVTGTTMGKGFQGVVRRHHMRGQPASRGTHEAFRHGGSIGNRKTPGRVFVGHRMPGHMGNDQVTVQNLKVVKVVPEQNVILVRGAVPGTKGALVMVRRAIKKLGATKAA